MFVHFDDHLAGGVGPGHQWNQCSRVLQHGQRAQQVKIMSRCVNDESTYWIWWLSLFINVHGQVASGAEAWRPRWWEVLGIFNFIEKWWKLLCNRFGHSCSCFQSSWLFIFPDLDLDNKDGFWLSSCFDVVFPQADLRGICQQPKQLQYPGSNHGSIDNPRFRFREN